MTSRLPIALAAAAGLSIGVAIGLRIGGAGSPPLPASSLPVAPIADREPPAEVSLRDQLEEAERRRADLARELAQLRAEHSVTESSEATTASDAATAGDAAESGAEGEAAPAFDEAALRAAGVSEAEIRRLRDLHDGLELDLLYLRDAAGREGWLRSGRFRKEARQLRNSLRAEIGDDDYDAMLYAGGRNNRVIVAEVLGNSPAASAGLEPGDEILRYGNERIFDITALTRATTRTRAGDSVELRILRDGSEERVFLPSGPIGIRLRRARQQPDTLR